MRVGIVCEGSTDFAVLEALALEVIGADECKLLQPDFDYLASRPVGGIGPGWQGVRRFLVENAPALDLPIYDMILIHVDASIRHLDEIRAKLGAPQDEGEPLQPLCDHVKSWAGGALPDRAIVSLPREELEAWLVAAHTRKKNVELLDDPVQELVAHGLLPQKSGRPQKSADLYRRLAGGVVQLASDPRRVRAVRELERTIDKMRRRARRVANAERGQG